MRKAILYLSLVVVVAFYVGAAGAAAAPYYGAATLFISNATAKLTLFRSHSGTTTPAAQTAIVGGAIFGGGATPTGTAQSATTATPTAPPATATLSPQERTALLVQRYASQSAHSIPRQRTNILVLGSDNDTKNAPGTIPGTQVMMVLSIDPASHTITEFSIPRDLLVHIPGYRYNTGPDGSVGWAKIVSASRLGFANAACTVERDFGIPIDQWVWVGLSGFQKVIDTLNGVTLDVTHPVVDDTYPDDLANPNNPYAYRRIYLPPGPQHVNGAAALHFVRSRHGDTQGDFGRQQRQQILITQLRTILLGQNAAELVGLAPQLLQDMSTEIKTSLSVDLVTAARYLALFRAVGHASIVPVRLDPPTYTYEEPGFNFYDSDPAVTQGGAPIGENVVKGNWQAIYQKVVGTFGAQDFQSDPQHFCGS